MIYSHFDANYILSKFFTMKSHSKESKEWKLSLSLKRVTQFSIFKSEISLFLLEFRVRFHSKNFREYIFLDRIYIVIITNIITSYNHGNNYSYKYQKFCSHNQYNIGLCHPPSKLWCFFIECVDKCIIFPQNVLVFKIDFFSLSQKLL